MDIATKRIHNGNEFENELSVRNLPTNELSSSRWLFLIFFSTTNDDEQIFSQLFALTEICSRLDSYVTWIGIDLSDSELNEEILHIALIDKKLQEKTENGCKGWSKAVKKW